VVGDTSRKTIGSMEESEQSSSLDMRGLPVRLKSLRGVLHEAAARTLHEHSVRSYSISISFVSDSEISRINEQSLNRAGPTDVIAFDLSENGLPIERVGDIYISIETALENSSRYGVGEGEELLRLVIHGVLHLLGYDDDGPRESRRMKRAQERIVKRFSSNLKC
jgi:probable rRNA maturation factor